MDIESPDGEIPEIDLKKLDPITSLITTFEDVDLKTKNVMNFYYDKERDYVFLELQVFINEEKTVDHVFGYAKEKIISTSENIIKYFCHGNIEFLTKYFNKNTNN